MQPKAIINIFCFLSVKRVGAKLEWAFLWMLAADRWGIVSKDAILGMYDGTLFEKIAQERHQQSLQMSSLIRRQ